MFELILYFPDTSELVNESKRSIESTRMVNIDYYKFQIAQWTGVETELGDGEKTADYGSEYWDDSEILHKPIEGAADNW